MASLQLDENPERGLSRANQERKSGSETLAVTTEEREYAAQAHSRGGVYLVLEGVGRIRVGNETLTVPKYGGVLVVVPDELRQVFNDTGAEVLWLIIGAPEELEFLQGSKSTGVDLSLIYPVDPKQLPKELAGVQWPPKS